MSKELPYFKFYANAWITGDITLESLEDQGVFVSICAIYWSKGCRVAIAGLSQRYGEAMARLLKSGIIKQNGNMAVIEFLDEQWMEFDHTRKIRSENGKKGNEIRWKKSRGNRHPVALRGEERREENTYSDFLSVFRTITGKAVRGDDKSKRQMKALEKLGHTIADFEKAIKNCYKDEYHVQNRKYLTPEFITRPDKFQKFLFAEDKPEIREVKASEMFPNT